MRESKWLWLFVVAVIGSIQISDSFAAADQNHRPRKFKPKRQQAGTARELGPGGGMAPRILGDPLFLPLPSSWYADLFFESRNEDFESAGTLAGNTERSRSTLLATGSYGLSDDVTLELSLANRLTEEEKFTAETGTTTVTTERGGLLDPAFTGYYRAIDHDRSPILVDFYARLSPSLFNADDPAADREGGAGSGRPYAALGGRIGSVNLERTISGRFELLNHFSGSNRSLSDNSENSLGSSIDVFIAGDGRYQITDPISVQMTVQLSMLGDRDATNRITGVKTSYGGHTLLMLRPEVAYGIGNNEWEISFQYAITLVSSQLIRTASPTSIIGSTTNSSYTANSILLGVRHLF